MQTLQITKKKGYAIVQLNRGKVNAINALMVSEIRQTIKEMQADDSVKGVILTGTPHFFTAGLDVIELYDYDKETMNSFFIAFGSLYSELFKFPKPLICAITGHSPAGGTVMAIAADYRIMAEGPKYKIGLNEVAVNIQISQKMVDAYAFWIGQAKASEYILEGKLLKVDEAKACGLINQVVPLESVLQRAEEKMQQYLMADPIIFKNTKKKLRKYLLDTIDDNNKEELEVANETWWRPEIRMRMKFFVDSLTNKTS